MQLAVLIKTDQEIIIDRYFAKFKHFLPPLGFRFED